EMEYQVIRHDRLGDVVVRTGLDGLNRRVNTAVSGQEDELGLIPPLLPEIQQINPAHISHLQVAQHHINILINVTQRLVSAFCAEDGKTLLLKQSAKGFAFALVVLNHKDAAV